LVKQEKKMPQNYDGQVLEKFTPPFEFDLNESISIFPTALELDGIHEFAGRYVSEWLLWHRSGRLSARVCDVAAFSVSVVYCTYLRKYSTDHILGWIEKSFSLNNLGETVPMRISDYSEKTLGILQSLRPTIASDGDVNISVQADEILQFALPIERLLILGGDNRLNIVGTTLLNGYGCRPFPRPEAITFSSSTATSISKYAFDKAELRRQSFIKVAISDGLSSAVADLSRDVHDGIGRQLGLGADIADVIIAASGTDSFLIAQGITRLAAERPMTTLIVGIDESGSGVKLALQQRHFADSTALTHQVQKGEPLSADSDLELQIDIPVRLECGEAIPTRLLDRRVRELVTSGIESGNHVVVHAMDHSKLGYSGPSKAQLLALKQCFGKKVSVVVDACQMRLDREDIVEYLENDVIVIITGSKYFTGPPFSGAILVPNGIVHDILEKGTTLAAGFHLYCAEYDFSPRLRKLVAGHNGDFNLGCFFRWIAAISEMERYFEIPQLIRVKAVSQFCDRVEHLLAEAPFLELQYQYACGPRFSSIEQGELSGRRMIFPFFLFCFHQGRRQICTESQVREIYTLLNQDCSDLIPYANAREYRLLAQMCHIGQPVVVAHKSGVSTAVLRISVGARVFSESYTKSLGNIESTLIEDELWQIGVVLGKIELLLGKFSDG
jgi:hypothetical protein